MSVLIFLTDRRESVASVRCPRVMTAQERKWLEAVPVDPVVEFCGVRSTWVRSLICGLVMYAIERGEGSLRMDNGVLVATTGAGEHRIILQAGPAAGTGGATATPQGLAHDRRAVATPRPVRAERMECPDRPEAKPRPFLINGTFCPGTYASHSHKED